MRHHSRKTHMEQRDSQETLIARIKELVQQIQEAGIADAFVEQREEVLYVSVKALYSKHALINVALNLCSQYTVAPFLTTWINRQKDVVHDLEDILSGDVPKGAA
jgi:hypothetical protein